MALAATWPGAASITANTFDQPPIGGQKLPVHDELPVALVTDFDGRHHRLDGRAPLGRNDERRVGRRRAGGHCWVGGGQL